MKKRNDLMRAIEGCYVRDIWHRKGAYIVYPKNSKAKKYYRNYSNRLVRRGKSVVLAKADIGVLLTISGRFIKRGE